MVSLVIPCYNEAKRLAVKEFETFCRTNPEVRLVFVDDGSTDGTRAVLEGLRALCPEQVTILPNEPGEPNRGKAEAVRTGVMYSIKHLYPEVVGFWDADLATPLPTVARFLEVLNSRPEIEMVFGSRVLLLGRNVVRKPMRHYLGRVFATAVSTMLRLPIYDTQCGAKLFRVKPHTRAVFAEPFLSKWVFDVEIIARYLRHYGKDVQRVERLIYEYPLETWIDVAGSKVRPTDFFKALVDILRIERRYLASH